MPIIESGETVRIEYAIPENIKKLITNDFLKEFRNQLFRIHGGYGLDTFAEYGIPHNTSTSGWFAAFGNACLLTKNEALLDYWRSLPWYDSDVFDSEISEMLIERKLILGDISKIIEEKLGIKESDLYICNDCGKLFTRDMMVKISKDEDAFFSQYRCLHCHDVKETKDDNENATDYYRNVLGELEEYKESHPLPASKETKE